MLRFSIFFLCAVSLFSCNANIFGASVKIGEEFTLKPKESVSLSDAGIKITLNQVGREWLANNGGERPYCEISIAYNGNETKASVRFRSPVTIGDYEVKLVKANPFGNTDATFVVNKRAKENIRKENALKFLAKYEIKVEDEVKESTITFPAGLNSPPYVHYKLASETIGLDLNNCKNLTLALLTFTLKGKTGDGSRYFAHIVFNEKNEIAGAWLSTNAPVAPGINAITRKLNLKE